MTMNKLNFSNCNFQTLSYADDPTNYASHNATGEVTADESRQLDAALYTGGWNAAGTQREGFGTQKWPNGDLYQGQWLED